MKAADVALYLQNNPQFFEEHLDLLAEIILPHPHGGRTISLSERQLLALREKNKALEKKLHDMVEFAQVNDALQHKVNQFSCSLFDQGTLPDMTSAVVGNLREIFAVPHAALHIWQNQPPSAEVMTFADQNALPICSHHAVHDTLNWFGEAGSHLRSFAYLPLHVPQQSGGQQSPGQPSIGLLIIASEDAQRFYPEMGTVFLQRIAEIVSCALCQHL